LDYPLIFAKLGNVIRVIYITLEEMDDLGQRIEP